MYLGYINKGEVKIRVDIYEYIKTYRNDDFNAHCFVCDKPLFVAAESCPKTRSHFRHHVTGICPTIEKNREKYINLEYRSFDIYKKEKLIEEIKSNLSKIYLECKKLCDNTLFYYEFDELLKAASKKRIWEYANIEIYHIPFCLLTLKARLNKTKVKEGNRKLNLFFSFSNQVISDRLWIDFNNNKLTLLKFEAGTNTAKLLDIIPVNDKFLNNDIKDKDKFNEKVANLEKSIH